MQGLEDSYGVQVLACIILYVLGTGLYEKRCCCDVRIIRMPSEIGEDM